ncbi:hypothetical protein PTTG_07920 [Puccinia triticina 1-1 BBBD Race 1]|uniref:PCI domain-containing protein n=1 Tax=Puccinia triticina (isolate 1-1 / race 1 (BBBD)) TaxID=630390 RepID=A0A180GWW3_PUCT1|nr:hypothetical protein PTTG_07920 [Puccinia triticina 1-1 BBBD Race 1]
MGDVHDLDHIKLDLNDHPASSSSAAPAKPAQNPASRIQTAKINHKLEYYLALVGASKGVALTKLVEDLLGSAGIYVFGEILETKPIQELASHPTDASYHELLEIFAYGTWKDYRQRQAHLPKLNDQQLAKLKLLSILTRASHSRIIPYSELMEELEIGETQALEELIIDGIYSGLLGGRLDQKYSRLEVETSVGRDVKLRPLGASSALPKSTQDGDVDMDAADAPGVSHDNTLAKLHAQLADWRDCSARVIEQLDAQISLIRQKDQAKLEHQAAHSATVEALSHSVYSSVMSSSLSGHHKFGRKGKDKDAVDAPLSSDHQMDIDEHDAGTISKTRKRTRP